MGKNTVGLDDNQQAKGLLLRVWGCEATVWKVRKHNATRDVVAILECQQQEEPPTASIVAGEVEAHIIAVCCSAPLREKTDGA